MGNYNFKLDLPIGKRGESIWVEYITSVCGGEYLEECNTNEWDIKLQSRKKSTYKYEVKNDVYIAPGRRLPNGYYAKGFDTGNIFIEFQCRGKDSGILVTTADYWVNLFNYFNEFWVIPVHKLKKLIGENNFHTTERSGDDGSNTCGYLIPREKFKEHFKVINFKSILYPVNIK